MKLLHLISESPPVKSGFSRVISRLKDELTKLGHTVDIFSVRDCFFKIVGEIKIVIGANKIQRLIRNGNYDVINVHGHTPTFSDRFLLVSKLLGKKVVYTFHYPVDVFRPLGPLYNVFFDKILVDFADAVVFTSKSYFEKLHSSVRKYVIPWGVDVDRFSGERIPHNGYWLLFVGQMRPYKGLNVLLKAVKGLDAKLNVVGDGPYRVQFEACAKKLGLRNVHFYGGVEDDVLRKLYLSSDVLILPSVRRSEAFGLVTLEAASAGCVVVASDLPGVRDVVREFGVLVKPNDPDDLRNALIFLRDENIRKEYVNKGFKAVAKYSWRKVAEDYVRVYRDVLSNA
ncbi:glycosyltransferase family 4 protein [Candidatus Bathyarchaeota archaeon]|nr:glycosyltransferase family 4 protein [Candidatus Bathyarchaeota archaeon]